MKKILFITHDDMTGGSAKSLIAQIEYFVVNELIEPIVITWKENSLTEYLRRKGIRCYAVKYDFTSVWTRNRLFHFIKRPYYRLFYNSLAYRVLKKRIDFSEISLILSNSSVIDFGAYLHRKLQIPHVWYLREFGDLDFNILSYVNNLPQYIENNSDGIIAVSNAVARHWSNRGIKKDIEVIYDGVIERVRLPKEYEKKEVVKICMCGRLSPAKGQYLAIKALSFLPQRVLDRTHIDFFGNGESEKDLQNFAKKLNLESYISFKGFSCNLDEELDNYDIGLTLSKAEAFGRTTIEYMNHALFVIGTNTGGTPELLQDGKCGALVDSNDPEQVAKVIIEYFENFNDFCEKATLGQTYANEKFAVDNCAKKTFCFYKSIWK